MHAIHLRVENLENPLGINNPHPRFSWELKDISGINKSQSAYRIVVASSISNLDSGIYDLWDSGKVKSGASNHIHYRGKELKSLQECYWKVKVWDENDNESAWSDEIVDEIVDESVDESVDETVDENVDENVDESADEISINSEFNDESFFNSKTGAANKSVQKVAKWVMGILNREEWIAKWIGEPEIPDKWIEVNDSTKKTPQKILVSPPAPMFRYEFNMERSNIKSAYLLVTALGEYVVEINGKRVGEQYLAPEWTNYDKTILYQMFDVKDILFSDQSHSSLNQDSESAIDSTVINVTVGDGWYLGLLGPGDAIRQRFYGETLGNSRKFLLQMHIKFEKGNDLIITSNEDWDMFLDGPILMSDHFMGETFDTEKESILKKNGWWRPGLIKGGFFEKNIRKAIVYSSINHIKERLKPQLHQPVKIHSELVPRKTLKIQSQSTSSNRFNTYIINMGQNMVGWLKLHLNLTKEDFSVMDERGIKHNLSEIRIKIRHGEMLEFKNDNKKNNTDESASISLMTENLRLAAQTDEYIIKTPGEYTLEPHFTFHGFQYCEISGISFDISKIEIIGRAITSATPPTGSLVCSSDLVNQLFKNINWTQMDNMHTIPTDCPQRNERMGWMGDATVFAQTAIFNRDMSAFFTKWIRDIRDAQLETGEYPDFAPHPFRGSNKSKMTFSPGWADAGVEIPWLMYLNYGDISLLKEHYESMKKYVNRIIERNPKFIWENWNGNYGDWLNGDTLKADNYPKKGGALPKKVYATMFYYYSAFLLSKMANILADRYRNDGLSQSAEIKGSDARYFAEIADNVKNAFIKKFMNKKGKIKGNTQAGYAIALDINLIPPELRTKAFRLMLDALKKYDMRISTGFVSTIRLMKQLSVNGADPIAYYLLLSTRFPSWGYSIVQGATTIWERWDGYVKGRGFQSKGMNSFNHYSIGAVGEWMYRYMLGINPMEKNPGYEKFLLEPHPDPRLKFVKGSYRSIRGIICSEWKWITSDKNESMKDDATSVTEVTGLEYNIEIPPNTAAEFCFLAIDNNNAHVRIIPNTSNIANTANTSNSTTDKDKIQSQKFDFAIKNGAPYINIEIIKYNCGLDKTELDLLLRLNFYSVQLGSGKYRLISSFK